MKNHEHFKNKSFAVAIVFVFAAKTVFFADTKIALAEKRPEATLELENPPFEPLSDFFGDATIAKVLALKNLATSGSQKISNGVYAVGDEIINQAGQIASVGESVADAAHKFYCTVSGWLGIGCESEKESAPITNVDIEINSAPVINRRDEDTTEVRIDVRKESQTGDDNTSSNNGAPINQTVIVNGITSSELERRFAIFKNSLDLSSGVTIINRNQENDNVNTDRIYEAMDETAENVVTGGDFSFTGIDGTFSGDVSVTGALVMGGSAGTSGYVLQSTGTSAEWVATSTLGISGGGSGIDTLAVIGSTANACGASISGTTLTLQPASASFGGVVTTGAQTFAGAKTFETNFGVGTSTATQVFHAYGTGGSKFTRAEAITSVETVLNLVAEDSGALADGDGAGLSFRVVDSDQAEVSLANIGAYRSGADNTGALRFQTSNAGTLTTQMTILPSGYIGLGTSAPDKALELNLGTTNALRLSYNDSDGSAATFFDTTLSSTGTTTFDTTGTSAGFVFNDAVQLSSLTTNGSLKTCGGNGTLYVDTASYLSCVNNLNPIEVGNGNTVSGYSSSAAFGLYNTVSSASSTAVGICNTVSSASSTAVGFLNTATGCCSQSFGSANDATGIRSSAVGRSNVASGCNSSAFGYDNDATGFGASAFGYGNEASSTSAIAFGKGNTTCGTAASTFGNTNTAMGNCSTAMGRLSITNDGFSTAVGNANTAGGLCSSTFGFGNIASTTNSVAVGRSNFTGTTGTTSVAVGILNNQSGGTLTLSTGAITGTITAASAGGVSSAFGILNTSSGYLSNAFGFSNTASGSYSSAVGYCNSATTINSVSLGRSTYNGTGGETNVSVGILNNSAGATITVGTGAITGTVTATSSAACLSTMVGINNMALVGNRMTSVGYSNVTYGNFFNTALGACNVVCGNYYSVAVGSGNIISASYGTAVGSDNTVSAYSSTATGYLNTNSATYTSTLGWFNTASAQFANAIGHKNTASGVSSTAIGFCNAATTLNSVVVGRSNFTGTGIAAVSIGILNNQTGGTYTASTGVIAGTPAAANSGCSSTAVGVKNTSSGACSSTFGYCNITSGQGATAVGDRNTASCYLSIALGSQNNISNNRGTAVGISNIISGSGGLAVGCSNTVSGSYSSAFGFSNSATSMHSVSVGRHNFSGPCSSSIAFGLLNNSAGSGAIDLVFGAITGTPSAVSSGPASIALGICNCSTGAASFTAGLLNKSTATSTVAVGYGNTASGSYSSTFGHNLTNAVTKSAKIGPADSAALMVCCTGASTAAFKFCGMTDGTLSLSGCVLTSSSDERLKNIQGNFTAGLNEIMGINPIDYTWKDFTPYDHETIYSGFSAQNIKSVIPTAISTGSDGMYGLNDRPILAASVNAIKELNVKSLNTDALALQNATDIVSLKTLLGEEGVSAVTLARFEKLDLDITDIYTLVNNQATAINSISGRVDEIVAKLESFGASVYEGIVTFVDVVTKKITSSEIIINNEENPEKTGLIIYDRKTGEPICIYFENGEMKTQEGECEEVGSQEDDSDEIDNEGAGETAGPTDEENVSEDSGSSDETTGADSTEEEGGEDAVIDESEEPTDSGTASEGDIVDNSGSGDETTGADVIVDESEAPTDSGTVSESSTADNSGDSSVSDTPSVE